MKPASPTPQSKPAKYGTRRKSSGNAAPAIKQISSVTGAFDDEEIEMDDLPVRANAPKHLIDTRQTPNDRSDNDGEERPRRQNRSRDERRGRQSRDRSQNRRPENQEDTDNTAAATPSEASSEDDRPARFGMVNESSSETKVQEFRPSRDGRTSAERKPRSPKSKATKAPEPKKKGILSKIISFFTGDSKEEVKQPAKKRSNNQGPGNRNRRGPRNRGPEGEDGSDRPRRKRRPRNRKPRPEGEGPNQSGNNENGQGPKRRRRPRRRNNQNRNDGRREGTQARKDSSPS